MSNEQNKINPDDVMRQLLSASGGEIESATSVQLTDFSPEFQQLIANQEGRRSLNKVEKYIPPSWVDGKPPKHRAQVSNYGTEAEHERDRARARIATGVSFAPPEQQPAQTRQPEPELALDLGFMVNGTPPPMRRQVQEPEQVPDVSAVPEPANFFEEPAAQAPQASLPASLLEQLAMQPPAHLQPTGMRINGVPTAQAAPQTTQVEKDATAPVSPSQAAHNEAMTASMIPDAFPEPPTIPESVAAAPTISGDAMAHGIGPAVIGIGGSAAQYFPYYHLPSQFVCYPFKKMWVRGLAGKHIRGLTVAANTGSLRAVAEVVGSVILTEVPEGRVPWVMYLTLPDYFTILYQLYSISFPRTAYKHEFFCNNAEHIKAVKEGRLPPDSLFNVAQVNIAEQEFNYTRWPDISLPEWKLDTPGLHLTPARVADMVYCMDNKLHDEEGELLHDANIACGFYAVTSSGTTLSFQERMALVDELPANDVRIIKRYLDIIGDSGVVSRVKCNCRGCGAEVASELALSAHSFFSD